MTDDAIPEQTVWAYLERMATALEQIALEVVDARTPLLPKESVPPHLTATTSPPPLPIPGIAPVAAAPAAIPTQTASQPFAPLGWVCPEHGSFRTVEAGVSKKTGRPYSAFIVCAQPGCDRKPPRS